MIKLYDTKLRRKVDFVPVEEGKVRMYVCGPTVYNRIHIGNARTFISFDTIRRYLMWRGFDVTFVQNVTDVDDKIIKRANDEGRTAAEVAREYTEAFVADMHAAGVADPDVRPKATEEIGEMIKLVEELIEGGHAYEVDGDVYFAVRSYAGYGGLSGRDIDEMEGGHRELRADGQGLEDRKRDPLDFALWKAAKPGEPSWSSPWGEGRPGWHIECSAMSHKYLGLPFDIHGGGADLVFPHHENERAWSSPWGEGRPGWHIECSAMSHKYLGLPFDIHGGGADLVFPHHENERAQSEAAYGCTFANHWMHSGMLQVVNAETGEEEKMSKSLNNFLLLYEVLEQVRPAVLRMLMLQTHYRSPLVFGEARVAEARAALERIENTVKNLDWLCGNADASAASVIDSAAVSAAVERARAAFEQAMDDDFNTAGALGEIFTFVGEVNTLAGGGSVSADDAVALGARAAFEQAMDDDFNTAGALGEIFTFVGEVNTLAGGGSVSADDAVALGAARDTLVELMDVLGVAVVDEDEGSAAYPAEVIDLAADLAGYAGADALEAVDALLAARAAARKEKNWAVADGVRDGLVALGFVIEDTPQGARVTFEG